MTERTSHLYGLSCPECSSGRLGILETRLSLRAIRRRRECRACGTRITTREVIIESEMETEKAV